MKIEIPEKTYRKLEHLAKQCKVTVNEFAAKELAFDIKDYGLYT
jgi:hypothetical protein